MREIKFRAWDKETIGELDKFGRNQLRNELRKAIEG